MIKKAIKLFSKQVLDILISFENLRYFFLKLCKKLGLSVRKLSVLICNKGVDVIFKVDKKIYYKVKGQRRQLIGTSCQLLPTETDHCTTHLGDRPSLKCT